MPIYVGDTPPIVLNVGVDVSGATTLEIRMKKPSGELVTKDATAYLGTYARYNVQDGELNEAGDWRFQAYAVVGGQKMHGGILTETIHAVLS